MFLDEESKVIRDNKSTLLYLAYSHEQLAKRRRATKVRGGNLQLMEVLTIFWGERPEIPRRDCLVYKLGSQTNEGNLLSAIQYQPWPQCWALPFSKKKELFGPFRRPVGGTTAPETVDEEVEERRSRFFPLCALMGVRRCQATADASAVEELPGATGLAVNAGRGSCAKRVDTNLEPVFFHSWHEQAAEAVFRRLVLWFWLCLLPLPNFDQVYKELCHGFCIKAWSTALQGRVWGRLRAGKCTPLTQGSAAMTRARSFFWTT